jgi:hypothetical protein
MSKRRSSRKSGVIAVGLAWFDREQWHLLREVAADRAKLDDTFEAWEANARRALADLNKSQNVVAKPFEVRVADLVQWCTERNLSVDGAARAEYVSFMLRRKHAGG